MMQVVYLRLASCGVSDHLLVGVAGCAIALANSLYGSATRPAHLYQLSAANGFGQGLFMAAFINLPNEYIATVWPHALAQTKGVPFPLFNLGQVLGPFLLPMMHAVLRPPGPFVAANGQEAARGGRSWRGATRGSTAATCSGSPSSSSSSPASTSRRPPSFC